jgi:protein-disulfide isomerase
MANNTSKSASQSQKPASSSSSIAQAGSAESQPLSPGVFVVGIVLLLIALGATGTLVWSHISGMAAPGCGIGSGCDLATKSKWGSLPVVNWPVSAVGFSYFLALLIAWLNCRSGVPPALRWLVRLGGAASLFYLGVLYFGGFSCEYCLATHASNLLFGVMLEGSGSRSNRSLAALARFSAVFAGVTLVIAIIQMTQGRRVEQKRAVEFAESTQRIIEQTTKPASILPERDELYSPEGGFTGRWRIGPENAPIRIVIISDYQCKDCQAMEMQVREVAAQRKDVSVSAKHYPFCNECNHYLGPANMHPNACWAARAAETAGIMRDNDGFWAMHRWLFDRGGGFTDAELDMGLRLLGYDEQERRQFKTIMQSEQSVEPVKADIDEATLLGLYFTPMVFINGVELRGFVGRNTALREAVEKLAAQNPKPGSPTQDRPQMALSKAIEDWAVQPLMQMPDSPKGWPIGPANARVDIVVWSDAQFRTINEVEAVIRQAMQERGDVRYTFRSFPQSQMCNPYTIVARPSAACWAAKAHEAAGMLKGSDGYWKIHDWVLANQDKFNSPRREAAAQPPDLEALLAKLDDALREAAPSLGFDADELMAKINSPEVAEAQRQQIETAARYVVGAMRKRGQIPAIYVNGRYVTRWKLQDHPVLREIIDDAAKSGSAKNNR